MSKKITIHFSNADIKEIKELVKLYGLKNTYGAIPKALKISITFSKEYIRLAEKVIPFGNEEVIEQLLHVVKQARKEEKIKEIRKK